MIPTAVLVVTLFPLLPTIRSLIETSDVDLNVVNVAVSRVIEPSTLKLPPIFTLLLAEISPLFIVLPWTYNCVFKDISWFTKTRLFNVVSPLANNFWLKEASPLINKLPFKERSSAIITL